MWAVGEIYLTNCRFSNPVGGGKVQSERFPPFRLKTWNETRQKELNLHLRCDQALSSTSAPCSSGGGACIVMFDMDTSIPPEETANSPARVSGTEGDEKTASYGLRREVLSPMETLAQSISTIAPTATPVATI